jgi:translation initiation factor 5
MAKTQSYINIGDIHDDDQFYRYKMPAIELHVEGKGNGVKTRVMNIDAIAHALNRSSTMIMKYFAIFLGTSVQKSDIGYMLRGNHTSEALSQYLNTFITGYVLCQKCTNPETTLKVRKTCIQSTCKACGNKYHVSERCVAYEAMYKELKKQHVQKT